MRRSPGEGSVYRRGKLWVGQVVTPGTTGRSRKRVVYGKTKGAVLTKLDEVKREVHGGVDASDRKLTFGQLVEAWLAAREPSLKWGTFQAYKHTLKKHGRGLWKRPIATIKPLGLDAHLRDLARAGTPTGALLGYRERLRQVFRFAVVKRLLPVSPADSLEPIRHRSNPRRTWERSEVAAFLAAARDRRLYPLFVLALGTGLRAGELLGLQWSDLDLDGAALTVRHTWGPTPNGRALTEPKTSKSRRTIPLSPDVVEVLATWRDAWEDERVVEADGGDWRGGDLVFSWPTGRPLTTETLARELDRIITTAKVSRLTPHGLRHTYATLALLAKVPVQVLSERLGHARVSLTMDVYVGVLNEQRQAAALTLEQLLAEPEATAKPHRRRTAQLEPN